MEIRPKIKLSLTTADKLVELLGMFSIVAIWILVINSYGKLPDTIPVHYDLNGKVDRISGKENIFALPIVATILFLGLTILNRFPHHFNYLNKITEETAHRQYTNATKFVRFLKLIVVIIFGLIVWKTIQNAQGTADGLGMWFLPIIIAPVIIPLIIFMAKSFKVMKGLLRKN